MPDFILFCVLPLGPSTNFSSPTAVSAAAEIIASTVFLATKFLRWRIGVATWSVSFGTAGW